MMHRVGTAILLVGLAVGCERGTSEVAITGRAAARSENCGRDVCDPELYGRALERVFTKLLPAASPETLEPHRTRLAAAITSNAADGSEQDPSFVYAAIVDELINTPSILTPAMLSYWRGVLRFDGANDTMTGPFSNSHTQKMVSLATPAVFAAKLVQDGASMLELFTKQTDTCPIYNPGTGAFTNANCFVANGAVLAQPGNNTANASQAGILTNPGYLARFYGAMGLRRARVMQETFACRMDPSELRDPPIDDEGVPYTSPWALDTLPVSQPPFDVDIRTVRGGTVFNSNEYIAFPTRCQNCHGHLHRRAFLFAPYDVVGFRDAAGKPMVTTPIVGRPFTVKSELLVSGEQTAYYRYASGAAADTAAFGAHMAADPDVVACFARRAYYWAMADIPASPGNFPSRKDATFALAPIPKVSATEVSDITADFVTHGHNFKRLVWRVFTDVNFVRRVDGCGGCAAPATCGATSPRACGVASCENGVRDGNESDVDCGGACGACSHGMACRVFAHCTSGVCEEGVCL